MADVIGKVIGILLFVVMIVALAIPVSVGVINGVVNPLGVTNETTPTIGNNSVYTVAKTPIDASETTSYVLITNGSAQINLTTANYTLLGYNSNYKSYNGTILFNNVNNATLGNATLGGSAKITYFYQQPGYDPSAIDQLVLGIIPLAFAVMVLIGAFGAATPFEV